jgi:AmmeMemoRadiSam system protein B/AmmeMemoRadiSam system protein A
LSAILSEKERISVFETAGQLVSATVLGKPLPDVAEQLGELGRQEVLGAFVSLKRSGQLRSCMGCLSERMPLQEAVKGASRRAAKEDPRFPEISPSELDRLDLEVWLLWGMQRVEAEGEDRIDAIEIGVHGVQIVYGTHRGLLLPGVAVDHQMDAESFLEAVCRKAGLPTDAWRDPQATLFVFHGIAVKGPLKALTDDPAKSGSSSSVPGPTREALSQLKEAARRNFLVMLEGGTPNYFFPGIYDGNVAGLTLSVELPDRDPILCSKISVRSNIPLQATLFDFVKSVQRAIQQSGALEHALLDAVFDLTIFWDVVLHGKAERPDIEGFDPSRRAMMLATVSGWVIEFDPEATPEQLLERAFERTEEANPQESSVYSFEAISTSVPMETSSIPKPVLGPKRRPPAVAGAFYPATKEAIDAELDHMLEPEVLPEKTDRLPEKDGYVAAMVPHAGWIYSGKLAAMTLSRVDFPDRILVFAPKHRQGGAAWAVAPHDLWELPGHEVPSDPEFAKEMAAAVPAFRLDAAAHQQEHSIEVQLPILHRLAPHAKVIGTTLHGGSHAVLQEAADQLARFLETLETPPLLVISTDMNHYANEDLTRRVDRMAIDAIEAIDPEGLLETVRSNRISMCGVVPAVLVLETLLAMGKLNECHTVGYTTSAAASGDTERVVGYAGMLFR